MRMSYPTTGAYDYITLHYITLHYITLHYITLHYITLHYITLHYITSYRTWPLEAYLCNNNYYSVFDQHRMATARGSSVASRM